ncbi:ATP-binding protein [Leclercia sp. S52]|uniref:ATP-binding protein n=1 Tax=Leclercia sp. S52 TaxID=3138178 RepID=UPI00321A24D6
MDTTEVLSEKLYLKLNQHISALLDSVPLGSDDPTLNSAQTQAHEKLLAIKTTITHAIDDLRRNAEHKTFTIAFYGETNAGKSTLIETLRILLNENSKQAQRDKFIALQQQSGLSEEALLKLENQISTLKVQYELSQRTIDLAITRYDELQQNQRVKESDLTALIADIKTRAGFFQRLLNLLRKLPEEKALLQLQANILTLSTEREAELLTLYQSKQAVEEQLNAEHQHHNNVLNTLHLLADYEDGCIIGDGRPDFTQETQAYEFELNGQRFMLLDVPGIEGDERKVNTQINNAVKCAHAVFYVTGKAAPPQTGDGGQQGTLEKIKAQLGDQTEVWTVYNKRINNPRPLEKPALVSIDEQASLADLDRVMVAQLGEHYRRSVTLCALPAFYAVATCLVPRSNAATSRKKFLDALPHDVLLEKTGILQFCQLLTQDLVTDVKAKIRLSNLNKVQQAFDHVCAGIKALQTESFTPLTTNLDEEAQSAKHQLTMAFKSLNSRLLKTSEQRVGLLEDAVRTRIYKRIDTDISNDQFQTELKEVLEEEAAILQNQLPVALEKQVAHFQKDVSDIVKRFEAHAAELLEGYAKMSRSRMTSDFDLKIDIDNGISIMGILGGLAGAVAMIWNPVAWPLMVLGAAGIIVSLAKALWSFFDSDYKKGQQRKAADENIEQACNTIRDVFSKNHKQALPPLQETIEQIKIALEQPAIQARYINQKLDVAHLGLKKMASELTR